MDDAMKKEASSGLSQVASVGGGDMHRTSEPQLRKNRSFINVLGQSLTIAAPPWGIGGPLMSSIYGGGQLSIFVGLIVVLLLQGCVAVSLAELASRYPTSSGVYYWAFRLTENKSYQKAVAYYTGWIWLIGNWTIALSVNFGFATVITAIVTICNPDWTATANETLFIFFGICVAVFIICTVADRILPMVDTIAAVWNLFTVIFILIALAVLAKAGRHSAGKALGNYDDSLSGWDGFSFFIGLLPPAYCFCAIGMVVSMSEECADPEVEVSRGITMCIPLGGVASLLFILPICFTMPALTDILEAPYGLALPYIISAVTENKPLTIAIMIVFSLVILFCTIGITTTASRCTWALARDGMLPFSSILSRTVYNQPTYALAFITVLQMLLGCINIGSTSAFTAFVSVGVTALAMSYLIPISISLMSGRKEVSKARWTVGSWIGTAANIVAIFWILFEMVLFSMPTAIPVTAASMNYSSVVLAGLLFICTIWYFIWGKQSKSSIHRPPFRQTDK